MIQPSTNAIERLHAQLKLSNDMRAVLDTPDCRDWFAAYEQAAFAAFLELPASANEDRYAMQIAIKTMRALHQWMVSSAAAGRLAADELNRIER